MFSSPIKTTVMTPIKSSSPPQSKHSIQKDQVFTHLAELEEERKRLITVIQDKKRQLENFQTPTSSPVEEKKRFANGSNKDGNIDALIPKWCNATRESVKLLNQKFVALVQAQEGSDGLLSDKSGGGGESNKRIKAMLGFKTSSSFREEEDEESISNNQSEFQEKEEVDLASEDELPMTSILFLLKADDFGGNEDHRYGKQRNDSAQDKEAEEEKKRNKEKADYKPSGVLAEDHRAKMSDDPEKSSKASILKWTEPGEAKMPIDKWILYPFKEGKALDPYHIHRRKSYLVGRDRTTSKG
eukprot:gene7892-9264_t